jgi:hypothetical protein
MVVHFALLLGVLLNDGPQSRPVVWPKMEPNMDYSIPEWEPRSYYSPPFVDTSVLFCEQPVYDFGEVWSGDVIKSEFMITNVSPFYVRVSLVTAGSGTLPGVEFGPYETKPVHINFNTRGFRGAVVKTITVKVIGSATTRPAE